MYVCVYVCVFIYLCVCVCHLNVLVDDDSNLRPERH
jgi:hypothetical protein